MTDALGLKDVAVASLESEEGDPPITTYMAVLKFKSVMYTDPQMLEQAFSPDVIMEAIVSQMRPSMLRALFDYLEEHDSGDLAALEAKATGEAILEMTRRNPFPLTG